LVLPSRCGEGRDSRRILVFSPLLSGPRRSSLKTITKKELVHRIAERTGVTKVVAKDVIQSFLNAIIDELAEGNRLEFREFGVFESRERAARLAQNPRTLEKVPVPAKRIVKFKVGRLMRKKVSGEDVGDLSLDDHDDDDGPAPQVRKGKPGNEASGTA
jgi:integration host factor subunit beta